MKDIIENDKGEILLQKRHDNGLWVLIGGSMEIGEKFIEVVKREAFEEAEIEIEELTLFGIYSGRMDLSFIRMEIVMKNRNNELNSISADMQKHKNEWRKKESLYQISEVVSIYGMYW